MENWFVSTLFVFQAFATAIPGYEANKQFIKLCKNVFCMLMLNQLFIYINSFTFIHVFILVLVKFKLVPSSYKTFLGHKPHFSCIISHICVILSVIKRDKTMAYKLISNPNKDTQNYPLCKHSTLWINQSKFTKVPKVVKTTNKKMLL